MKRIYLLITLYAISILCLISFAFPATMMILEWDSFFSATKDFFLMKLSQGAAINGWMSDYLLQFFKWPVAAAAINALLASLLCLICVLVLKKLKTGNDLLEIGVIPVLMLLLVFPFQLNLLIEGIAFYAGLLGYLYLKQYRWHFVYAILFLPLGFLLISIPLLVLFYVLLMVFDYMFTKKTVFLPVYLLCIVTTLCLVKIVSNQIGYIPFETRYFYTKSVPGTWYEVVYLLIFLIPLLLTTFKLKNRLLYFYISVVLILFSVGYTALNQKFKYNEKCYKYVILADNKDWHELKSLLAEEGSQANDEINLKYNLLADCALGKLADNLFNYTINNPEEFLFRQDRRAYSCIFNALFYENAQVYDEAFHQFFEYGLQNINGKSLASLRHCVKYSVKEADFAVAEKYLDILEQSILHGSFISEYRHTIDSLRKSGAKPQVPLRADNFIGGYPFNSEMVRQLQEYPQNKVYLDYLLCGLLLQKNLPHFKIILENFPLYKNKPLPKAYAEACAMIRAQNVPFQEGFIYPEEYDQQFRECYQAYSNGDENIAGKYINSFWYYYFYASLPQEIQMSNTSVH